MIIKNNNEPYHRVRNEDIRRRSRADDAIVRIAKFNWIWAGYVERLRDGRWTKKILEWRQRSYKRNRAPPSTADRTTLEESLRIELQPCKTEENFNSVNS